jgi:hypothetical protein
MFGEERGRTLEEPLVLPSLSLCDCAKLGNENFDA